MQHNMLQIALMLRCSVITGQNVPSPEPCSLHADETPAWVRCWCWWGHAVPVPTSRGLPQPPKPLETAIVGSQWKQLREVLCSQTASTLNTPMMDYEPLTP